MKVLRLSLFKRDLVSLNYLKNAYGENVIGVSVTPRPKAGFSGVSRPYQLKLLKQLKSRAECALWFVKSYGPEVGSI